MVWAGCCGHKSSNATAAGFTAMSAAWGDIPEATPPIKLLNRDNAAAAARGTAQERAQLYAAAKGGAKKTAENWGAMCKNKDDKKGYQDNYSNAFEVNVDFYVIDLVSHHVSSSSVGSTLFHMSIKLVLAPSSRHASS
jgi:hypothetical protein